MTGDSMEEHILVTLAKRQFLNAERETVHLVDEPEINAFLNDIEQYPHAYVLACLMDRQIKAEKAWSIPFYIKEAVGSFTINALASNSLEFYQNLFMEKGFHRFNRDMAEVFFSGVLRIKEEYCGDASKIWADNPSSAAVVYRFLQFKGCGIKIATMATNILARQFKIPLSDYYSIDISPDVHVDRVLKRIGLVNTGASREAIVYKARELNPEFPGIIDFSCWEIGRQFCKPQKPLCDQCPIYSQCKRVPY
jgi:endonuclease III